MSIGKTQLGQTPLTDPRSVLISLVFNGALLLGASLMAIAAVMPHEDVATPRVLKGEVESTDNRADYQAGGGSPGEQGGMGVELSADRRTPVAPTRDPAADALLAEILPTKPSAPLTPRSLPGPSTSGLGLIPGLGAGGRGRRGDRHGRRQGERARAGHRVLRAPRPRRVVCLRD